MPPDVETLENLVFAVIAVLFVWKMLTLYIEQIQAVDQKRIITTVAVANGLLLELSYSPIGSVATELALLGDWIPQAFPEVISFIVAGFTFFEVLYGIGKMLEGSGLLGLLSFGLAFLGGSLLPYREVAVVGVLIIGFAILLMEAAPANQWTIR